MIRNKKRKKQTDMSSGREQQKNAGIDFFCLAIFVAPHIITQLKTKIQNAKLLKIFEFLTFFIQKERNGIEIKNVDGTKRKRKNERKDNRAWKKRDWTKRNDEEILEANFGF